MSTVRATNFQHASAAAPAIVLAADGSATANVSSINNGPLAGMRNAIINGNFDIWQRGTSAVGEGFHADRFNAYLTAGSSFLQERYTLTDAQRNVIGYSAKYALACFIDDTASSIQIQQSIEEVRTLAEQQVTVSFWAFTSAGTCTISSSFAQVFGTGGSPSSSVFTSLTLSATTVTTTPTKITATVTLPSISGKTLGSNGDDYLGFLIQRATGVATTLYIAQVQVELGPVATPFERRPIGTELALCQRYFQLLGVYLVADVASGNPLGTIAYLSPNTRTTPVISIISTDSSNLSARTVTTNTKNVYFFASSLSAGSAQLSEYFSASAEL
jgi:hypothetical protein